MDRLSADSAFRKKIANNGQQYARLELDIIPKEEELEDLYDHAIQEYKRQ